MRFMAMVKYTEGDADAYTSDESDYEAMARYNEELVKAGVMLAGEGLHPSENGALVKFTDGVPTVIDGPFAEGKELIGGFWILEVRSREEALEWIKRAPFETGGRIEVRQLLTEADFEEMTDEQRARHGRIREEIERRHK